MTRENYCNYISCQGNCLECEFPDFVIKSFDDSEKSKYIISNLKERKPEAEICGDNRFEIIEKAKSHLLNATNIENSPEEMNVIDSFLFRCWQMGWLDRYDDTKKYISEKECGDCDIYKRLIEVR